MATYLTFGDEVSTIFNKEYLEILRLAASGSLPKQINKNTDIPSQSIQELVDAGYLRASVFNSTSDGVFFNNLEITATGREYLGDLESKTLKSTSTRTVGRMAHGSLKWLFGIVAGVLTGVIITFITIKHLN